MKLIKNTKVGKINILNLLIILILIISHSIVNSQENTQSLIGNFVEIKVLDKVSSKNHVLKIKIGEEKRFKNISIKPLKCKNSEFDDNPEITAYIQVRDTKNDDKNDVFVFNGWMFSSSPSITPFDHPVYDIWLVGCN